MKQLIFLVRGNYAVLSVKSSEAAEQIIAAVREAQSLGVGSLTIIDGLGAQFTMIVERIDGWFYRNPPRDPQQEMLDIMKKQSDGGDDGEAWKKA